ncbi:peptidylprolyl isomerase [Ichthyenterobacterium sp. W332]|uniref:Peptidylprolyl isomerase n=1 Tax=Microcosmobacter mediterraneus TaxID=3075607 RepID=A0ABU2YMQ2_9FLAO|nr:peptidylprolyl isomerase [Ichthyenterobacterium sp. W332]MDT0559447.1 peptidylprolyl isomerase [Ichthyenterobacterium sp. W332]
MSLKSIINKQSLTLLVLAISFQTVFAQEIIKDETPQVQVKDSIKSGSRVKVDGVAAVVGDYVVLSSDIDKEFAQIRAAGGSIKEFTRCELFGKLLEDKLYAHHAIQDSITVNELQIRDRISQQIEAFIAQAGTMDELLKIYNKDSEQALKDEMFEINKNGQLAAEMQRKIVSDIEVTPEEVRQFFNDIPKDERPIFGTELNVAQIVIIPEVSEAEEQKAINQLKQFKEDIEGGSSFASKVVLYSDDIPSRKNGGKYTLNRNRPRFVKEFRETAFSLQEGEISDPVKTIFGYHMIQKLKERGQEIDVRHILIRPEITSDAIAKAKQKLEDVRAKIVAGEISFADAAREVSDEDETKYEGGKLTNPVTQDFNFELTKMQPELYAQIQNLNDDEVSLVLQDEDRINPIKFKILTVTNRIDEHEADYSRDYLKIKNLALQDKQFKAIEKWQKEKINDTYVKINGEHRDCEYNGNWLKN